jgi:ribosomal protein L17
MRQKLVHKFVVIATGDLHEPLIKTEHRPGKRKRRLVAVAADAKIVSVFAHQDRHGFRPYLDPSIVHDIRDWEIAHRFDRSKGGLMRACRAVFRKIDRNGHRAGERCGINVDENAIEVVSLCRNTQAMRDFSGIFTKFAHR